MKMWVPIYQFLGLFNLLDLLMLRLVSVLIVVDFDLRIWGQIKLVKIMDSANL